MYNGLYDENERTTRKELCDSMVKRLNLLLMERDRPEEYQEYVDQNWRKMENIHMSDLMLERRIFNNAGGIDEPEHINIKDLSNLIARITLDEELRSKARAIYNEELEKEQVKGMGKAI